MNKLICITFIIIFSITSAMPATAASVKKALDHAVYDGWKNISGSQLSPDGRWSSYEANPQQGDGWLHLINLQTQARDSVARGGQAKFSPGSDYLAYLIRPEKEEVRQAKLDEKSREEMPKDHLGIIRLYDDERILVENIRSFSLSGEASPWMVYHKAEMPGDTLEGTRLTVFNPVSGDEHHFDRVASYAFAENGRLAAFTQHEEGEEEENGQQNLQVFNTQTQEMITLFRGDGSIDRLTVHDDGSRLAFLYAEDNEEDPDNYSLYYWDNEAEEATMLVTETSQGMPEGWSPSAHSTPHFSDDGMRLFFGTAPIPEPEPEDTLLPEEKHRLDVWHYEDPLIQPMQLVQKDDELKRTYTAIYHLDEQRMVQLADEDMPDITTNQYGDGRYEMGESKLPYLIPNSFESGDYRDVYLVDVLSGEREMVLEKHRGSVHLSTAGNPRMSPGGQFLLYYDQDGRNWHTLSIESREHTNITDDIPTPLYDELHDTPSHPDPHGVGGWIEEDRYVLIYDRFDIWRVDLDGEEAPEALTNGYGRENNIRFRYVNLDPDKETIGRRERIMLSSFHIYDKQSGFHHARAHQSRNPEIIVMDDVRYFRPAKAEDAETLLWRKSTFQTFPDLWVSDLFFNNPRRISDVNPQQDEYRWGSVKLVDWVSFANDTLQGKLYLPEDMDPEEEYPMIVYFYDRSSDGLHMHQVPSPSRSTVNRSYLVSNGYIVFVPDIRYRIGYPGQSAYEAIVSGTKAMLNRYDFIDRENIGIQGQSWAGYQIAWLITRTDIFTAAMAGAPVSNMISAYGGIRWSTGMSRIYQYEQTQSRIGGTIWDKTMRYVENSPVFFADRVNTPLLMMHNDDDGAVPWYQGIEYFMALRRLGQPVWMLNYNDEAHNLRRWPNRMDLSIRMYQFFDHYLKGEPAPVWMEKGIPAVRKGIDDGYELTN